MQASASAGTAACSPRPRTESARPIEGMATSSSAAPTWEQLPPTRRRRLVVTLGALVERTRMESNDDEPREEHGDADGEHRADQQPQDRVAASRAAGDGVQSTAVQVVRHGESTRLQYGLTDRAAALGWPRERIAVIDDDLGRSGASAEGRPGFQRLVAEVGLDHVGIILGIEDVAASPDRAVTGTSCSKCAPSSVHSSGTSTGSTIRPTTTTGSCSASRAR
jgi:hypothetical protein